MECEVVGSNPPKPNSNPNPNDNVNRDGLNVNSGVRARNLSKRTSPKSESVSSRDTLAYEPGSALIRVNLSVSFSAWAELVWRY